MGIRSEVPDKERGRAFWRWLVNGLEDLSSEVRGRMDRRGE